jgi:hypothetical protein
MYCKLHCGTIQESKHWEVPINPRPKKINYIVFLDMNWEKL